MNKYYIKYLKYKIKYMSHKLNKEKKFRDFVKENLSDGLINIDFLHDNSSAQVKGKGFYDMINEKSIKIYNDSKPTDLESFMHNELIDIVVDKEESVLKKILDQSTVKNKISNLEDYVCVLDKSADNQEMELKLKTIFGITQFEKTFVGNCEQFLNSSSVTIDKQFLNNRKNLKTEYMIEAIKIGFLPISKNKLLNFNILNKTDPNVILNEFQNIKLYINESIICLKNLSDKKKISIENVFYNSFVNDLKIIKLNLDNIVNEDDVKNKYLSNNHDVNTTRMLVEKIIFSLKEARDIYYIEEIKNKMKEDSTKKYILVSSDLVQCYRAIIDNVSTINLVLSLIRFMAIYKNNELSIIGNPFELVSSNSDIVNKYLNDNIRKDLIKDILSNPVINLKRNLSINTKYFLNNYDEIYDNDFLFELKSIFVDDDGTPGVDLFSSTELNLVKKKEYMDYLLNFSRNNIKDENDLFYIMHYIRFKQSWHGPFDHLIDKIHVVINRNTLDEPCEKGDKPIEESTWQFQIFYLCMVNGYFALMEYMLPIAKKFYPNEFNWDEVEQLI